MDEYIIIDVPDINDSMSYIELNNTQYMIRFTWIDTFKYWTFGLYDALGDEICIGMKIVPKFPVNIFSNVEGMPLGVFGVLTNRETVERDDFVNGTAQFIFYSAEESEAEE